MSQELNQRPKKQKFSVAISTDSYQRLIGNTLRDPARARRFTASITSAVAVNPALQECDAGTILSAALLGESLNLSPSPQLGQYYLVPFNDRKAGIAKAQFILGYKGYLQLAMRSGNYKDIEVTEIRQGEYLGKDSETGKPRFKFIENDDEREKLPVVGYMASFEYLNGFRKTLYWSKEKMLSHADQYSKAFSRKAYEQIQAGQISDRDMWKYSSFWYKNFDEMAKKTMLRQLISKWGIMSIEMQEGYEADSGTIRVKSDGTFVTEDVPTPEIEAQQQPVLNEPEVQDTESDPVPDPVPADDEVLPWNDDDQIDLSEL